MTLHLYALLDAPLAGLPPGAFGDELVQVAAGPLVAVAGRLATEPSADEASAVAHAGVVEALATATDALLPSRFGLRFRDEGALAAAVAADAARLAGALDRVRGCVELGLRALFPLDDGPQPRTGRAYLERRAAAERRLRRLVALVHEPLARRARDAALEERAAPLRLRASYLVPRRESAGFAAAAAALAAQVEDAEVVVHGPWPPYSFGGGGAR